MPSRQATFREERQFAALDQPLISTGRLTYRRPAFFEKATEWPIPERLVVDGDRLVLTAGNEPPRVVDLGSQTELRTLVDAIRGPLSGDLAALRRGFAIGTSGTAQRWTLDLAPRDPRAARLLRRAQVSGVGDLIVAVRLEQANGDAQAMTIGPPH